VTDLGPVPRHHTERRTVTIVVALMAGVGVFAPSSQAGSVSASGTISVIVSAPVSVTGPTVLEATTNENISTLDGSFLDFFVDSQPINLQGSPFQAYTVSLPTNVAYSSSSANVVIGDFVVNGGATPILNQFGAGRVTIGGEIGETGQTQAAADGDEGTGDEGGDGEVVGDEADGDTAQVARPVRPILNTSPFIDVVINYN
jgi:hypothetical protein